MTDQNVLVNNYSALSGWFKIEKHQEDSEGNEIPGSREVVADWFPNLITNNGLNLMASAGFLGACHVGTSNAPPTVTDNSLGNFVAGAGGAPAQSGPAGPDYVSAICTYTFAQGAAAGNLQEIGIAPSVTSGNLFSRALILDGNGDPTVLVITPIDILTVTYQLREYPSQADVSDTIVDGATSYSTVSRGCNGLLAARMRDWVRFGFTAYGKFDVSNGGLGAWTSGITSGTSRLNSQGSVTVGAYSPGTHYRDQTVSMTTTQGNVTGGISAMQWSTTSLNPPGGAGHGQCSFSPPIAKDNTKTLTITCRTSWGRYSP